MIKGFKTGIIIRVILLSLSIFLLVYLIRETPYHVSIVFFAIVIYYQIFSLIKYIDITNKQLKRFLEAIAYSDYSQTFSNANESDSFAALNKAFNKIIKKFEEERVAGEINYRYLQTVVQHIGIGLFSFDVNGQVELINTAAKRLLNVSVLTNISQLTGSHQKVYDAIMNLRNGEQTLFNFTLNDQQMQLSAHATEFKMKGNNYKLISLQNINSELEAKEMEAWQNLTQVLAHEIMNSITPIASLSATVNSMISKNLLMQERATPLPEDTVNDVTEALSTIHNRSLGLMRFVNSYRNFTQIPQPSFELVSVQTLLKHVVNLMKGETQATGVAVYTTVDPESLEVIADPQLIEQALINLMKNAIVALSQTEQAKIQLTGKMDSGGRIIIEVEDNGPGIKESVAEKIFVPFYTTRPAGSERGTGIGLSLSRQIMRLHNGSLFYSTGKEKTTKFTLRF